MIELVPLSRQFQSFKQEILQAVSDTIDSGHFILGPNVSQLEREISDFLGTTYSIGVANGTDALVIALDAYGIGAGDEVITTPFTFFASAEAVSRVGATPVFADIDPHTYCIHASQIEEKITPATKAIIPVHLFGQAAHMQEIMAIAEQHGLVVIEDACQAFGACYQGKRVGSIGHAACFSFFPTKNLSTLGDGGLIATSDKRIAERIRRLRKHGSCIKYYHSEIGYNSRLDEIHAAIIRLALPRVDEWNKERGRLAARYREALNGLPDIHIEEELPDRSHTYHLFCIRSERRDEVKKELIRSGIQCGVYYPLPLHLQDVYQYLSYKLGDFPVTERVSQQLLALPLSPFLREGEQDQVINVLSKFLRE